MALVIQDDDDEDDDFSLDIFKGMVAPPADDVNKDENDNSQSLSLVILQ